MYTIGPMNYAPPPVIVLVCKIRVALSRDIGAFSALIVIENDPYVLRRTWYCCVVTSSCCGRRLILVVQLLALLVPVPDVYRPLSTAQQRRFALMVTPSKRRVGSLWVGGR